MAGDNKNKMIEGLKTFKTVGGNRKGFRKRKHKKLLMARKLYHMVRAQTLKMMIRQNIIQNPPVTVDYIEIV